MPLAYRIARFLDTHYGAYAQVRIDGRIAVRIIHVDCDGYVEAVVDRVIDANVDALREFIAPPVNCYDDRPYVC